MQKKVVALFDLDGTITYKDSFIEFIRYTNSSFKLAMCTVMNIPYILLYLIALYPNHKLKERFFSFFFKGMSQQELEEKGRLFCRDRLPGIIYPDALHKIRWHQEQGHDVIVLTASSAIWLSEWCAVNKIRLIATEFETINGRYTGRMSGRNCFGKEKAERIKYLIENYQQRFGYGNARSDRHFLALTTQARRGSFKSREARTESFNSLIFILVILASVGLRFLHFGELIDDPHGWRQCDTANYIWDFYRNGVDFFHPSVCWMGGYRTLVLEFPLPEAIVAWLSHVFGHSHVLGRFVFLFFFCGGVYYCYKICLLFFDKPVARLSAIIYTFLPLSYYYSRALHIDYFALSFAFAMFYYYITGIRSQSVLKILAGSLFATIALLVKAPYAVFFCLPLLYIITKEKKWLFCIKWALLFIVPLVIFILWIRQSAYINALAPDWYYIPGYRRFDENSRWYFGAIEHRFILRSWNTLLERLFHDMTSGLAGVIFLLAGMITALIRKKYAVLWLWFAGVIMYMLVFFNLNVLHNYYQIPFAPVFAVFMALGIFSLSGLIRNVKMRKVALVLLSAILIVSCIRFSEKHFFTREKDQEVIAQKIMEHTAENDLVIVSYGGLSVHCPNILYRARRHGWSVPATVLTAGIATRLAGEGCRYLAFVDYQLPDSELGTYLRHYRIQDIPVSEGRRLFLVDLQSPATVTP